MIELALEVDRPDLVRGRGDRGHRSGMLPVLSAPPMTDAIMSRENVKDRASRRPLVCRIARA